MAILGCTMKIKQGGLAIPFVLLLVGLTAVALWLVMPSSELSSAQKMRFKHATWWHWQRAIAHYYHRSGGWPDSLHEVAEHFGLPSPPDFIIGYADGDGFRIRFVELTLPEMKMLTKALMPFVEVTAQNGVDVLLSVKLLHPEEPELIFVSRFNSAPFATSINFNKHGLAAVDYIQADHSMMITGNDGGEVNEIDAGKIIAQRVTVGQSIQVERLSTFTEIDILERLTFDIQMLYAALNDYMDGGEQYSNHPH